MNYLDRIKSHLSNWWEYAKEHFVRIVVILIITAICIYIFTLFPKENVIINNIITEQHIMLLGITLENWFTWGSLIGLIFTAIWAIYQFDKSTSRKRQEKGAEIAKEFSKGLLLKCGIVTIVYKKSKLYNILNSNKEYDSFRNFTISELREIYGNDLPYIYRNLEEECDLDNIYHTLLKSRISLNCKCTSENSKDTNIEKDNSEEQEKTLHELMSYDEIKQLFILDNKDLPFHFSTLVDDVLNELEYLCMDISSQAADSKYIYQSLHQIFFRTIKILSIEICLRNNGKYCDKFYTNVIHVYNEWTKIYEKDSKKEENRKKEVDKILNPKIKTV